MPETKLIPNVVTDPPPGPWLVFAPHADDETFGMGGTLLLGRRQGIAAGLVIMTDGALGGEPQGPAVAAVRECEAEAVGGALDVQRLQFWGRPDGKLAAGADMVRRVSETMAAGRPATVFFPSPMELNPDHRAAASLVWQGLHHTAFGGAVYAYEITVAVA